MDARTQPNNKAMSSVSRSVYQKLKEENKRLLSDIKKLTTLGIGVDKVQVITKWREKFRKDEEFHLMLKKAVHNHFKKNPIS